MTQRIPVYVYARDPVVQTGLAAQLRGRPELRLVEAGEVDEAAVAVIAVDELDDDTPVMIRAAQRNGCPRVLLVVARLDEAGLLKIIEAGVSGLLRRAEATAEHLTAAIRGAVAGDGVLPPDLTGQLLSTVNRLQRNVLMPRGLTFAGLTQREIDVLQLAAEGYDTKEIASKLSYSERTIKNVIHDVTLRLNLRNRTHAVAYALKQGLL